MDIEKSSLEYTIESMLSRVNDATITITPHLAKRIIEESNWEGQRAAVSWHIDLLAGAMNRGQWRDGEQISFAKCGDKLHLVNGQHRMKAVIQSDMAQKFQIKIHHAATLADVGAIYYTYDVTTRKRSTSDIIGASDLEQQTGLDKPYIKKIYDAAGLLSNGLVQPNYHNDPLKASDPNYKMGIVVEWAREAKIYRDIIKNADQKISQKLRNAGVMAVAFYTIRYQPEIASEFWSGVANNDGLRKGDPRHTYVSDLMTRNMNAGTQLQRVSAPASAWNAYIEGRQLKIIKVYADHDFRLAGTPIKGGK